MLIYNSEHRCITQVSKNDSHYQSTIVSFQLSSDVSRILHCTQVIDVPECKKLEDVLAILIVEASNEITALNGVSCECQAACANGQAPLLNLG